MTIVTTFLVAFFFSFIGTIPPGTINLTIVQMGLEHRTDAAWRFAAASAIIEYIYGWLAVEFESAILESSAITQHFELISAVVMLGLGVIGILSSTNRASGNFTFAGKGFRKGIILGVLNPLALPFWLAMTAYNRAQGWVSLESSLEVHAYLFGVATGGFSLLMIFFFLAKKVVRYFQDHAVIQRIPSITLLVLGAYALVRYLVR